MSRAFSPQITVNGLEPMKSFLMATEGSAQAMGWAGKLGRIAKGYKADLVFLDLGHINYVPCTRFGHADCVHRERGRDR